MRQSISLAAALWRFHEKLICRETPNPNEFLAEHPDDGGELESMLALLYWGKVVLSEGRDEA